MNWILGVVAIALLVVLMQLVMIYQKRSADMHMLQEPLRRRIQLNRKEIRARVERVQRAAEEGLQELEYSIEAITEENNQLKKGVGQLQLQIAVENEDEEELEDKDAVAMAALDENDPRLLLRKVQQRREEIDTHLNSLKRDAESIKRNEQRVEAKLTRSEGENKK